MITKVIFKAGETGGRPGCRLVTQTSVWNSFVPVGEVNVTVELSPGSSASTARRTLISWIPLSTFLHCNIFISQSRGVSNPAQALTVHLVIHLTWRLIIETSWWIFFSIIKNEIGHVCRLRGPYRLMVELCVVCSALGKHFLWARLHFTVPPASFCWSGWCYIIAGNLKRHRDCGS